MDTLLQVCLSNSFKDGAEASTIDNFVHTIKTEVIGVMALMLHKIVSVEPEILLNSQFFTQLVELLCKVLMYVYEKDMVGNTLGFF